MLKKIFTDIHTGIDNASYDFSRIWGSICLIGYHAMTLSEVFLSKHFDQVNYATGLTAIFVAIAAQIKIKETTERKPDGTP